MAAPPRSPALPGPACKIRRVRCAVDVLRQRRAPPDSESRRRARNNRFKDDRRERGATEPRFLEGRRSLELVEDRAPIQTAGKAE